MSSTAFLDITSREVVGFVRDSAGDIQRYRQVWYSNPLADLCCVLDELRKHTTFTGLRYTTTDSRPSSSDTAQFELSAGEDWLPVPLESVCDEYSLQVEGHDRAMLLGLALSPDNPAINFGENPPKRKDGHTAIIDIGFDTITIAIRHHVPRRTQRSFAGRSPWTPLLDNFSQAMYRRAASEFGGLVSYAELLCPFWGEQQRRVIREKESGIPMDQAQAMVLAQLMQETMLHYPGISAFVITSRETECFVRGMYNTKSFLDLAEAPPLQMPTLTYLLCETTFHTEFSPRYSFGLEARRATPIGVYTGKDAYQLAAEQLI